MSADQPGFLQGRKILIVEDEYLIAQDLVVALRGMDADVAGPAGSVAEAERLLDQGTMIDLALLNVRLRGGTVFALADRLEIMDVPFLFVSGYDASSLPERFMDRPRVEKPVQSDVLMERIRALLDVKPG